MPGLLCVRVSAGDSTLDANTKYAAAQAGLSYSNAWLTLNRMEEALGCRLVERKLGGATGGGSSLTQDGLEWVARYRRLEQELFTALLEIQRKEFH